MLGRFFIGFSLMFLLGFSNRVGATHLVGGEITYRFIQKDPFGNNVYEITLYIYQDCLTGRAPILLEDNPAYVGIFTKSGVPIVDEDSIFKSEDIPVPPNFSNDCVNNPPPTCMRRVKFVKRYALAPSSAGYRFIYSRCCRNATINNINRPDEVGATYYCDIPSVNDAALNNSAVFKQYPPQIICINNPLVYDHSATDIDGDSLSYELCDAYPGASRQNAKPFPSNLLPQPIGVFSDGLPSPSFGYKAGYSSKKPMGGNPLIQINPTTGQITGTPNLMGRFVVSVCCNEWRGGKIINTVHREFQFVVTNCSKAVVANIPQYSEDFNTYVVNCKDKTILFINQSAGGFSYDWSFGVPGAVSSDFSPRYTYPDTGTYRVSLVVNKGSTCPDSIDRLVKVYPTHAADFTFDGLLCPNAPITFTDKSEATYKPITAWKWMFGDGFETDVQNPIHQYQYGHDYSVTLISTTIKGCKDTITKKVDVERFRPFAGNDTIIVKGEIINFNAQGGNEFVWTPGDKLNLTNVNNPTGTYPDTGRWAYNVHIKSINGCEGDDSIKVWVVNQPALFMPTGFTPNGDGLNDMLRMLSVGYSKINFFRVFNRWGQVVFQTDKIANGWDGTFKGKEADIGTYFWILSVKDRYGKDEMIKGDVTLIR